MLGVDERYQGLGAQLLRDAILNSLKVSELAGARALVVDPAGEAASAFCRRFGFFDLSGTTRMVLRLILPTARQQRNVCLLNLASFNWERGGAKCIFKG